LGGQRKRRVIFSPATGFQMDATKIRSRPDRAMQNFNFFDWFFRPIDFDSHQVQIWRRRLRHDQPPAVEESLFSHGGR